MVRLTKEEKEILDALESGDLELLPNQKRVLKEHQDAAKAMLKKDKRLNIRISSRDLNALQARAHKEGIPYQTLVSSILHKYVDGQLIEQR